MSETISNTLKKEMSTDAVETTILRSDSAERRAVLEEGHYISNAPKPNMLLFNSVTKCVSCDHMSNLITRHLTSHPRFKVPEHIHFGQKGKSQMYADLCDDRTITLGALNHTQDSEGRWNMHEGDVGVSFGIPVELVETANALFQKDLKDIRGRAIA